MNIPSRKDRHVEKELPEWVWEALIVFVVTIGVVYSVAGTVGSLVPIA